MTKTSETEATPDRSTSKTKRLLVACGAALLPLLLAVSCSTSDAKDSSRDASPSSSKTLDAAFVTRAEKVCAPYAKYNSTHYFKVSGFNRFDPDAALLPRVAAFASRNPSYRTLASDLEKLGRPDTGRAEWSVVLDNLGTGQRLMKNEIASAQRRDVTAFAKADAQLTTSTARLHGGLVKLGLSQDSTCYNTQGDPFPVKPPSE